MKTLFSFLLITFCLVTTQAQQRTQTVRGRIVDTQSEFPLTGVNVIVLDTDPLIGTASDIDGYFKLTGVPVGRQTLQVTFLGYGERTIPNVMVTTGKEVVLNLSLEEKVAIRLEQLLDVLSHTGRSSKKRFLVKKGEQLIPVADDDTAYFYTENELVYLTTHAGKKYVLDYTLEQLSTLLDPVRFFRINRQFIVSLGAVQQIHTYFSSRLKLQLQPAAGPEVLVSKGQVKRFKAWLEGVVSEE